MIICSLHYQLFTWDQHILFYFSCLFFIFLMQYLSQYSYLWQEKAKYTRGTSKVIDKKWIDNAMAIKNKDKQTNKTRVISMLRKCKRSYNQLYTKQNDQQHESLKTGVISMLRKCKRSSSTCAWCWTCRVTHVIINPWLC